MSRRRRSRCLFELDKKEAARRAQNASIYCVISHGMANYGVNTFSHLSPGVSRARNKTPGRSISPLSFDKAQKRCKCEWCWCGSIFTRTRRAPFVITSTHLQFRLQHSRNEFCCRDVSLIAHRRAHSFCMCSLSHSRSVLSYTERECVAWCISASFIFSLWSAQFENAPLSAHEHSFIVNQKKIIFLSVANCRKISTCLFAHLFFTHLPGKIPSIEYK